MTFSTNIAFDNGVPVGGWAEITISKDGSYRFTGHLHDSGALSYDTEVKVRLRGVSGQLYELPAHTGIVNGTFTIGSRDDDWDMSGHAPWIASAWDDLEGSTAIFNAEADGDDVDWEIKVSLSIGEPAKPSPNPMDAEQETPPHVPPSNPKVPGVGTLDHLFDLAITEEFGQETLAADVGVAGDTSGDGQVNFADLAPFVKALTDPTGYDAMFPALSRERRCDINGDGACNFADLRPFVNLFVVENA
jgi:hypothetical protein